ncbi:hypothetical protein HK105_205144 [Polyrhizophydium stewartii]|uniref:Uncharacterized protein n=1 Tax=Polyrhizophydium stewartii TaxID=2732419 RepID=A0ABR4N706_9FUNG
MSTSSLGVAAAAAAVAALALAAARSLLLFTARGPHALPRWVLPSDAAAASAHRLVLATTTHTRHAPARHSFRYPLFYLCIDLARLEAGDRAGLPSWLFGYNRQAPVSLWDSDHLAEPASAAGQQPSIRTKALAHLRTFGVDAEQVGRIVLVTSPRVLGKAFNPLSVYYVYSAGVRGDSCDGKSADLAERLLVVLYEVNNTFKERHLYLGSEQTRLPKTLAGYDLSFTVSRSFHVSPFNNRTGRYESHVADIRSGKFDVLLNIKGYTDTAGPQPPAPPSEQLHLTARVFGVTHPLTTATLLYTLLVRSPFDAFLTVPRIMYEAFKLAYLRGLPVFQRPTPYSGVMHGSSAQTVVRKHPDAFQHVCVEIFTAHLSALASVRGASVSLVLSDGTTTVIGGAEKGSPAAASPIKLFADSFNAFVHVVMHAECPLVGLHMAFTNGDFYASRADITRLLALLASDERLLKSDAARYLSEHTGQSANSEKPLQPAPRDPLVAIQIDQPAWKSQVASGIYLFKTEQAWFKSITKFVSNGEPWLLPQRVRERALEYSLARDPPKQDCPRNVSDEVGPVERERMRSRHFLSAAAAL